MESQDKKGPPIWVRVLRVFLVLALSLAIAALFLKNRPRPGQKTVQKRAPMVEVVPAHETSPHMIIEAYGTLRSGENLNLTAQVGGEIVEMADPFEEGVYFPEGAFLMRIDPRDYDLNVEKFEAELDTLDAEMDRITQERKNLLASLEIAQEELELAKSEYDRNLALSKRNVVSRNQLDQMRQKWLVSRQRVQEIQNALALIKPNITLLKAQRRGVLVQLKGARLALERTVIRAPFGCRVAHKRVEKGQYVTPSTPLAGIYNVALMEVEVRIPPAEMVWLPLTANHALPGTGEPPLKARIVYHMGEIKVVWDGEVSRIKGQMEESTRTLPMVFQVEHSHPSYGPSPLPGMFVTVHIQGKRLNHVFSLPRESVHQDGSVYAVKEGKARARPVKVIRAIGNKVYVRGDLSDGDEVITLFPGVISDGMEVRVRATPSQGGRAE